MPNVASLINKNNIKKHRNNQRTEPPKCNFTDRTNCSFKRKCQFECIVYKVEVYGRGSNDSDLNKKKVFVGSMQVLLKKKYHNHRISFAHELY